MRAMPFLQIRPYVRHVQALPIQPGEYPSFTKSYDCRLFYVNRGEGKVFIEDRVYNVSRGDMVLWQSGVDYRMDAAPSGMQFLCVNFDFTPDKLEWDYPVPPDRHDMFDESAAIEHIHFTDAEAFDRPVFLTGMQLIEGDLLEMKREYLVRKILWRERLGGLMASILAQTARKLALCQSADARGEGCIDLVISYIQEHFAEDLDNVKLGRQFNFHPNYLNRQMLLFTGKTLHQYLILCRMQKAIEYLESSDLPISEIARLTGFCDMCHFSKLFKQKIGNSPSFYRRPR